MFQRANHYLPSCVSFLSLFTKSLMDDPIRFTASLIAISEYLHGNDLTFLSRPTLALLSDKCFFQQQAPRVNKKAFHRVAVMEQIPLIPSTLSNYEMLRFLNCSIKNVFHVKT